MITCDNCGIIVKRHRYNAENHFCGRACNVEWHYFNRQMSVSQLNVLEYLQANNGTAKLEYNHMVYAMQWKIAPLVEVMQECDKGFALVRITSRGEYWLSRKRGIMA